MLLHHHHHVMDLGVMDHHHDLHLLVVHQEDHRRHHPRVHHDRVDKTNQLSLLHRYYFQEKQNFYFKLSLLTSFSQSDMKQKVFLKIYVTDLSHQSVRLR
jgi:hypothetical protein